MAARNAALDATDWKILAELQKDARKTYQEIGESVGLTRPAVRERVLRLEEAGVITGYRAVVDCVALGRTQHAMLSFKFNVDADYKGQKPNDVLRPILDSSPEVVNYWQTYGDLDFIIETAATAKAGMDDLLDKLRDYGFVRTHIIATLTIKDYVEN